MTDTDIFNEKKMKSKIQDNASINHLKSQEKYDQSNLVYGRKLQSPILGYNYQLPDLSTNCVPATTLDTSLLHVIFKKTGIFPNLLTFLLKSIIYKLMYL